MVRSRFLLLLVLLLGSALFAASYQQMETVHTQIIFEEGDVQYASDVAAFADEVFEELSAFLIHTPSEKVPVVITGNTAWANGYYINFPSAVYLYVTSPEDRFIGSRTQNWLRSLFVHELTHYLHLTAPVGPAKFLRFIGPEVTAISTVFMPGWWIEGITTYAETAFSASGGRGDSLAFLRIHQTALAEKAMWSLSQGAYRGPFNPSSRIYVTGYLMVDHLIRHYGSSSFAEINRRFAAFPFFGLSMAFKKVTGHTAKEIFTFALQEAEVVALDSSNGLFAESLMGDRFLPEITSKGLLGYVQSPYTGSALYRYAEDGKAEKLLELHVDGGSAISFANDCAVFSSLWTDAAHPSSLALSPVSYSDLYLLDLASLKARRLTNEQRLVHPDISGDGERIVASKVNGPYYDLVEIDADTSVVTTLLSKDGVSFLEPELNQDGSSLLVLAMEQGNSSLYLLKRGGVPQLLVGPTSDELRSPRFAGDDSILFSKELELYQLSLDSGEIRLVHTDPVGIYSARLEGGQLLYETYTSQGIAVKQVAVQHHNLEQTTLRPALAKGEIPSSFTYQPKPYYDSLKFNLVLPFPFVEANDIQPGVWFHTTSLLRRHSLIGSVGLSIKGARPVTDLTYQHSAGSYALALGLQLNSYQIESNSYVNHAYAALQVPVLSRTTYYSVDGLNLQPQLELVWNQNQLVATGAVLLGYGRQTRNTRTLDFFGSPALSASGGVMVRSNALEPVLFVSAGTQVRLFDSSSMLHLGLDVIGADSQNVGANFSLFSFAPLQDGNVKVRLSSSYRLPLGLLDVPIPYGGLTGAGLELIAQSAWYLNAGSLVWEGAWAVAARLSGNALLGGSSVAFRPFAQLVYLVGADQWQFTLGMDGQSLFSFLSLR